MPCVTLLNVYGRERVSDYVFGILLYKKNKQEENTMACGSKGGKSKGKGTKKGGKGKGK